MYDVAYYWSRLPAALRDDFLDSYHHQRPLTGADLDLLPLLARAAWIKECTDAGDGLPLARLATLLRDPRLGRTAPEPGGLRLERQVPEAMWAARM
jgi:Ser/Thr protein kinase RdoA (MazF antagonist)